MNLEQKARMAVVVYEAVARRDLDSVMACYDREAEFDFTRSRAPHRGVYRGLDEIRKGWEETLEPWREWVAEPHHFAEPADDGLLFSARARMTGRDGITLNVQSAHLWTFSGGRVARAVFFQDRAEAEAAAEGGY